MTTALSPETGRTIRLQLALIPVYAFLVFAWWSYAVDISPPGRLDRSGHIKGHDFVHFYVLGKIALDRAPTDLYSFTAQGERTDRLVPEYEDRFLPVHGPQVAMFFAPLARLPYVTAVTIWLVTSAAVYLVCCGTLWWSLPNLRSHLGTAILLCVGFPGFYILIASGQTSAFALAWLTVSYLALKRHQHWLAGFAFGALVYKPSLGVVLPFALVFARQWRMIVAAAISAAMQFVVAALYFGPGSVIDYVRNFASVARYESALEAQPHLMHSLRTFFAILLPWPNAAWWVYYVAAIAVIVVATRTWKSAAPLELRYSVLVLATVLVDPHVYAYELVVLLPSFFLAAAWLLDQPNRPARWVMLYLSYYLPALGDVANVTRIQPSVAAMLFLMLILARAARLSAVRSAGSFA